MAFQHTEIRMREIVLGVLSLVYFVAVAIGLVYYCVTEEVFADVGGPDANWHCNTGECTPWDNNARYPNRY